MLNRAHDREDIEVSRVGGMPPTVSVLLLLWLVLVSVAHPAGAEVRTWDGEGGTTAWSNNVNWSGDVVPGAADIAYFDGTSDKAATITAAVNVAGIVITADYDGTITQNAGIAITVGASGYDQAGATFLGGTSTIDVNGPWALSGGSFTSTTGGLYISGDVAISGGSFAPRTGTVRFDGTQTISANGVCFYSLYVTGAVTHTITAGTVIVVTGTLTLNDGYISGGTIEVQGPIAQASSFDGGTGLLRINGTEDQTFTGSCTATTGTLPDVSIEKATGTLTLAGTIRTGNDWTYVSGTLDPGASTLVFAGTLNVTGTQALNVVQIRGSTTVVAGTTLTVDSTLTMPSAVAFTVNGTVIANAALALTDGSIAGTGALEARAGITQASTFDGGLGTLLINGPGDQIFSGASTTAAGDLPHVTIDKPSGTLTLSGTLRIVSANWTYTAGALDPSASTLIFDGTLAITGSHDLPSVTFQGSGAKTLAAGTVLGVSSTLTLTDGSIAGAGRVEARGAISQASTFDGGTGSLHINGVGDQILTGACTTAAGDLPDVVIEKPSGALALAGTIRTGNDWTYVSGTLDCGTSTLVFAGTLNVTGTHALYAVQIRGNTTVTAGTTLTVNDTMTLALAVGLIVDGTVIVAGTLTLTDGTIDGAGELEAHGDITQASAFDGGTGTLRIHGTGAQTLTGSSTTTTGSLCDVVIDKSAGTLTLSGTIRTTGDWTYTAGGLAVAASTVVFAGAPTITGSQTLNDVNLQGDVTVSAGTTLTGNGTVTLTDGTLLTGTVRALGGITQAAEYDGGSGTLLIAGTGAQTFTGAATTTSGSLPDVEISKPAGALTLAGIIRTEHDWTHVAGTVDAGTSLVVLGGNLGLTSAGMAFHDLRLDATAVTLGSALDVDGDFSLAAGAFTTAGHDLTIGGDWSQSGGSFSPGASTVTFDGSASAAIVLAGSGAGREFHDVILDKTGGAALALLDDAAIGGDLILSGGVLEGTDRTLWLDGDWLNNAGPSAFAPGSGSVELRGGAQVIGGAHPTAFHTLGLVGSDAKTAQWDLEVSNLSLAQDLVVTPHVVRISGATTGAYDVIGTVRRGIVGNGPYSLGSAHTTVTFTGAGTNPDSVDVTLSRGAPPPGMPGAIQRYYDVSASGGAAWSATLRLHYREDELNGNVEGALSVWREAAIWERLGRSGQDYTQNWIERSEVEAFSRWALASGCPDHFLIDSVPSPQMAGVPFDITVTAADSADARFRFYTGEVRLTSTAGPVLPAVITFSESDSGRVTQSVLINGAGASRTIMADDGEGHLGVSNPFTITPSLLKHFVLGTVLSPRTAGVPFELSIAARDSFGNLVTGFTGALHLTVPEGGLSPETIVVAPADSGRVTRSVRVGRAGSGIRVRVTDDLGHAGSTNPFTVLAATVKRFVLEAIPSPQIAGEPFDLTLWAADPYGNLATDYTGTVDLTTTAGQILPARIVFSAEDQGRHTGQVSVTLAGSGGTITAQDQDRHTGTSAPFAVIGSALDHFAIDAIPSPQQVGTPFDLILTALDRFGNQASGAIGSVDLTTTAGAASPSTLTFTESDGARHTERITVSGVGTGRTVSLADSAGRSATSNSFTVTAGPAVRLALDAISSPQIAGVAFDLAVAARDAYDNVATGYAGTVELATTAGLITPSAVTLTAGDQGRRSILVRVTLAGDDRTIAARDPSGLAGTSQPFRVDSGSVSRFLIADVPSPQAAGSAFPLVLTAVDSCGNRDTGFLGAVSLTTTAGSITPARVVFTDADSGCHGESVAVTLAAGERTIRATDEAGHTGTSAPFTVEAGPAASLAFLQQPGGGRSGSPLIPQPIVELLDGHGNRASETMATIAVALPAAVSAALLGTTAAETREGLATFTDLRIDQAGSDHVLIANADGLQATSSSPFEVVPGPAARLAFLVQPGAGTGGAPLSPQPRIAVRDAAGNLVTTSAAAVAVVLADSAGGATLSGTASVQADAGVARFADLSIDRAASGYRLLGLSEDLTAAQSHPFDVRVGSSAHLAFLVQPDSGSGGGPLVPQPAVVIRDLGGNQVASDLPVTIALGADPTGGELSGSRVVAAADGLAAFTDLAIARAGEGYQLTATAPGLPAVTGAPFPVHPGPSARLAFAVQPGDGRGGEPLSRQPVVAITDIAGNLARADGAQVTLRLAGGCDTAHLGGPTEARSMAGLATFSGLSVDKIGTGYTLLAEAAGRDGIASQPFHIITGNPAAMVALGGLNQRGTAGDWLADPFRLRVVDAGENALAGTPVRFRITATPRFATGQELNVSEVATDPAGEAGVRLRLGDLPGTYLVSATLSSLPDSALPFAATAREQDGTGTVSLAPEWVVAGASADLAFTIGGDERATNVTVRLHIPPDWTWTGQSSDVVLQGGVFSGATVSVAGDGSILAPYAITVDQAHISRADAAILMVRAVTAPEEPGPRVFVVATAALLGVPAPVIPSPEICVRALAPGDANLDDEVDLLDVLWATDFVLGTRPMSRAQSRAADVFPAHASGQARKAADGRVESADVELLKRAILMQAWDDGLPLGESSACPPTLVAQRSTPLAANDSPPTPEDVTLAIEETGDGLAIRLANRIPIRGIQLNLPIEGASPTDLECRSFHRVGRLDLSWAIAQGQHRILLWNPSGECLAPGDGYIVWIGAEPDLYRFADLSFVIAGTDNQPVATLPRWGIASNLPTAFRLHPGRPNPFRDRSVIAFDAPQFAKVKIEVFDASGRLVRALLRRETDPGEHEVFWLGTDEAGRRVASGLYWCRMTSGSFTATHRLMLLD